MGGFEVAEGKEIHLIFLDGIQDGIIAWKAAVAIVFAVGLRLLSGRLGDVLALPLSFVLGVAAFLLLSEVFDFSSAQLVAGGWLLPMAAEPTDLNVLWMEYENIDWAVVLDQWRSYVSIAVISALALLLAVTGLELSTKHVLTWIGN